MLFRLLITIFAVFCFFGTAQSAKRVALVIGNAKYEHFSTLANPPNDAREIAQALQEAKFDSVVLVYNLSREALSRELQKFSSVASGSEIALIYYAGHGVEVDGTNYLVPVDATLLQSTAVSFEAIPLDLARTAVSPATGLRMVILDACRNNPFKLAGANGKRGGGRGLRAIEADSSEFIAYSAKEGTTAMDGPPEGNSPFAKALATAIRKPGLEVRLLFGKVRDDVFKATNKEQEPFTYASLGGEEVYLNPPAEVEAEAKVEVVAPTPSGIRDAWSAVSESGNVPALIGFKKLYANDPEIIIYGPLVDQKLEEIKQARQVLIEQEQSEAQKRADEKLRQQTAAREAEAKLLQDQKAAELLAQQQKLADEKTRKEEQAKRAAEELVLQKRLEKEKTEQEALAKQAELEKQEKARQKVELLAKLAAEELQKQQAEKLNQEAEIKIASVDPSVVPPSSSPLVKSEDGAADGQSENADVDLTRAIQVELKRLGCLPKSDSGGWGNNSRLALTKYRDASNDTETPDTPSQELLAQLQGESDPTICDPTETKADKPPSQIKQPKPNRKKLRVIVEPRIRRTIVKPPKFVAPPRQPKITITVKRPKPVLTPAPKTPRPIKQVATNAKRKTKRCTTWIGIAIIVKPC